MIAGLSWQSGGKVREMLHSLQVVIFRGPMKQEA